MMQRRWRMKKGFRGGRWISEDLLGVWCSCSRADSLLSKFLRGRGIDDSFTKRSR
jgi:hypothetical protein